VRSRLLADGREVRRRRAALALQRVAVPALVLFDERKGPGTRLAGDEHETDSAKIVMTTATVRFMLFHLTEGRTLVCGPP